MKSELPAASELEGALRNGVYVARLAMFFAPDVVKQKHIYDFDETVYKVRKDECHFCMHACKCRIVYACAMSVCMRLCMCVHAPVS